MNSNYFFLVSIRVNSWQKKFLILKRYKIYDLICLILLVAIGLASFGFLFNAQPFIYDDNSFHYFTLHYAVTRSIPIHHRLIDWNPYWFAGIPELQFYPPGSTFIGILLYYLTLTLIPIGQIYNLILLFALFFPSLTSYYLLRKIGYNPVASFITGLIILILLELGHASGVFYGVLVGLTNSRIALGFYPLILWFGIKTLVPKPKYGTILVLAILIGIAVLCHPYHIFLPIFGLAALLYAFNRTRLCYWKRGIKPVALAILLGAGLSAFWWLPMLVRHNFVSSLQIWSGVIQTINPFQSIISLFSSLSHGTVNLFFLLLYLISAFSILNPNLPLRQKSALAGLILTPILMLGFLIFVQVLLIPIFHFYFLDPVRLKDGFFFSVIITSGIGIGSLISNFVLTISDLFRRRQMQFQMSDIVPSLRGFISCVIILFAVWFMIIQIKLFYTFPRGYPRFGFLPHMVKSYQLDDLWDYLKQDGGQDKSGIDSGRILFTASAVPYKGMPHIFQAHVMSLTPIYSGRQILSGLNTPFYTVASYLFFGKKAPLVIRSEADKLDNVSFLGIPWEQMDEQTFYTFCTELNVSTIVVNRNEDKVVAFLSKDKTVNLQKEIDNFLIYSVLNYVPNWIQYDISSADIRVVSFQEDRITLAVTSAASDIPVLVKAACYPCWQAYLKKSDSRFRENDVIPAKAGTQSAISIAADEIGLMHLVLPQGENYQVDLIYKKSWVEWFGWFFTIISLGYCCIAIIYNRLKKSSRNL